MAAFLPGVLLQLWFHAITEYVIVGVIRYSGLTSQNEHCEKKSIERDWFNLILLKM